MSRDIEERLALLSNGPVEVVRVALNMDQVDEYDLPENPVKMTDSRAEAYRNTYGDSSWELDAIEPSLLASLVEDAVTARRDDLQWKVSTKREDDAKDTLQTFIEEI